jgi:hypothetical protein
VIAPRQRAINDEIKRMEMEKQLVKDLHKQLQELQNEMLLGKNRLAANEQPLMPNRKPLEEEKKGG